LPSQCLPVTLQHEAFQWLTLSLQYRELEQELVPEWRAKYLDYKVRTARPPPPRSKSWTSVNETRIRPARRRSRPLRAPFRNLTVVLALHRFASQLLPPILLRHPQTLTSSSKRPTFMSRQRHTGQLPIRLQSRAPHPAGIRQSDSHYGYRDRDSRRTLVAMEASSRHRLSRPKGQMPHRSSFRILRLTWMKIICRQRMSQIAIES
jgi:hypothetical protein